MMMLNNSFRRLLVVTAVTPTNAVRRILCLHYSGGSAVPFVTRAAGPLRGAAASKYRDGRGAFWEFEGIDAPNGDGVWWEYEGQWSDDSRRSFNVERYEGADESIAVVEQQLSTGRFSGLMGLGQGALLAAIVAARAALGETSVPSSLQFAIICGGATPMPFKPLLTRLRDTADAGLPTLHLQLCVSCRRAAAGAARWGFGENRSSRGQRGKQRAGREKEREPAEESMCVRVPCCGSWRAALTGRSACAVACWCGGAALTGRSACAVPST